MVIRTIKRLSAAIANAAIRRLNAALDGHNARVAEQSRQAVEQWTERTPVSPKVVPVYPPGPYIVYFGGGERRRFTYWQEARGYFQLVNGHGLVNEDRQTDGSNYAGLTEEQRGEIGL